MAELFSECYHNSEERAFALLVRKNQYWSKTTCLQLATEADAKSFFAHDGVQVSFICPRALGWTQERTAQELNNPNEYIPLWTILGRRDSSLPLATDKEDMSLPKQHNFPFPHPLIQLAHRPVCWGEGLALNPSCAFCFLFLPCSQRSIRKAL